MPDTRHLGQEKPKSMAALTTLMTRFCAGEDSWLARSNNMTKSPGNSDTKDSSGRSRRNKQKRRINGDNAEDTTVNAGFKRHLGQEKPKSMAALTTLMTRFCAGEDSWLARSNNMTKSPGNSDTKDSSGRSRRNKQKRRINGDNAEDTTVNAGFKGSKPGQQKKPFKRNTPGPSRLDRILDRSCQIHGTHSGKTCKPYPHRLLGL